VRRPNKPKEPPGADGAPQWAPAAEPKEKKGAKRLTDLGAPPPKRPRVGPPSAGAMSEIERLQAAHLAHLQKLGLADVSAPAEEAEEQEEEDSGGEEGDAPERAGPSSVKPRDWSTKEFERLKKLVAKHGTGNWAKTAAALGTGRSATSVASKWQRETRGAPPPASSAIEAPAQPQAPVKAPGIRDGETPTEGVIAALEALVARRRAAGKPSSAFRGVSWRKEDRRWQAKINRQGHREHLGLFIKEEQAKQAYEAAVARLKLGPTSALQTSQFLGVSWNKSSNKWRAEIFHEGKRHRLGTYEKEKDAAKAYADAATRLGKPGRGLGVV